MDELSDGFLRGVSEVLECAQQRAKTAVNLAMVYAYYEIGRRIVEEEQGGAERAAYGKLVVRGLSVYLTHRFGKVYSVDNLKLMRDFTLFIQKRQLGKQCLPNCHSGVRQACCRLFHLGKQLQHKCRTRNFRDLHGPSF